MWNLELRDCVPWDAGFRHADGWADAPPISLLTLPKEKRAVHGPKRKNAFGRNFAPEVQSCCTGVGVRWCLRIYDDFLTGAAGCGTGLNADSRGAGLFPRVPLRYALPGSSRRRERQRKEKQLNAITTLKFTPHRARETDPIQQSCPARAGRRLTGFVGTDSENSRRARRATAPERAQRFSLWTVHGPFLFWQDKREMGGASRWTSPPAGAESPEAAVRRPLPFPADQLIQ